MIFSSLIALFATILSAKENQAKAPFVAEAVEGCGCGAGKPACLSPIIQHQNYQDINVDVIEYYNFETSFPYADFEGDFGWTGTNEGYYAGFIQVSTPSSFFLNRNAALLLNDTEVTYISAQIDYVNFADPEEIESPLGAGGDPFYAAGFFLAFDFNVTGLEYGYAITNTTVFAIYGRSNVTQTPDNNYKAFRYLVPLQPTRTNSIYSLILNKEDGSVSWMVDGLIRMIIPISGKLIDEKFLIDDQGGLYQHAAFPSAVTVAIGSDRLRTGTPYTACQDSSFQYCDRSQNIFHADNVECVYEPIQNPDSYTILSEMVLSMFSITVASSMEPACNCPR